MLRVERGALLWRKGLPVAHEGSGPRGYWGAAVLWREALPGWWLSLEQSAERSLALPWPQRAKARATGSLPRLGEGERPLPWHRVGIVVVVVHEWGRIWLVKQVLPGEAWLCMGGHTH